ncbi:MAG: ferritin [Thermosipho sp. (in: Bacteria)]|nr:ferritin [Thermosipho sp. (in: thermotogales)]
MISERMVEAINKQINEELYSSYLYLSMAAYFEDLGLKGFANWMIVQSQEEKDHAMKFYYYLASQGAKIKLYEIKEPPSEFEGIKSVFKQVLKHEQHITKKINELVDIAEELKDRATFNFLQWYIDEQVGEEENAMEILNKLEFIGDNKNAIFMLDRELGQRQYIPLVQDKEG